jgi:ABC-type transport system involved in multi-copper enzyme maturation permease subunit
MSALVYRGIDAVANAVTSGDLLQGGEMEDVGNILVGTFGSGTAFTTAKEILKSDTLIYTLIVVFIVVSAIEFSSGTIKNTLTSGISRRKIYYSKFALSCIYTTAYYIVFFVSSILCSMLVYWQTISLQEFGELIIIGLKQIPIYISIIAAGHCFIFATQSTVASVALYIVTFMVFNTLLPMFNIVLKWDMDITLLFPLYQCIELTNTDTSLIDYLTIYGSTLFYIISFVIAGSIKFKKAELK